MRKCSGIILVIKPVLKDSIPVSLYYYFKKN